MFIYTQGLLVLGDSMRTSAWIGIVVALFVIGLGAGYAIGHAATPSAPIKTTTSVTTSISTITKTVTKTVTITLGATYKPEYTFYYISHGGPADPWWAPVIKGAELAAKLLHVKVVYLGPPGKFSIKWLVDTLEAAAAKHPDGIIITITDYKSLDKPLRRVISEGIPVIAVNVPDPRPKPYRIPYTSYIGQNETIAGYKLALYVLQWFKHHLGRYPKGAVIAIHEAGHIGLEMRAKGIQQAFAQFGLPKPPKLYITTDETKAYSILKAWLEKHRNTEVIFTLGPLGTHPAMKLIKDLGLKGKVWIAAFDIDQLTLQGIKEGIVIATISQQPFAQGFLPVVFMYLYVKYGIMPPEHVPTGPTIIDASKLKLVYKQIETTGGA